MAAHDVSWGYFGVEPALCFCSRELQSILFNGLVFLGTLAKAKTYDQQSKLLGQGPFHKYRFCTLYRTLFTFHYERSDFHDDKSEQHATPPNFGKNRAFKPKDPSSRPGDENDPDVSDFRDPRHYACKVKHPFFDDPDDGPFILWKWAHDGWPLSMSVLHLHHSMLRKGGYVMWDRARLYGRGILYDDWEPVLRELVINLPDAVVYYERWRPSWQERSRIYVKGGRGWWDFGDESKIIWTRGRKSRPRIASMSAAEY